MIDTESAKECCNVVYQFAVELNEWERKRTLLGRIADDKYVSEAKRKQVVGVTIDAHDLEHARIFGDYVVPRLRKYGSNPGRPNGWGRDGKFAEVSKESISEVRFPAPARAEVIAEWGVFFPGGKTMFVLKRIGDQWKIDSLKLKRSEDWEIAYF